MELIVIRHARAESAKDFMKTGADDDLRPLTDDGRERMRLAAAGLHRVVDKIDVLASSPLVRAKQTAEIVAAEFDSAAVTSLDELRPDVPPDVFAGWLQDAGARETIAIVGHETQLRQLVGWLLTGKSAPIVEIKKGAAVMLELRADGRRRVGPGGATLLWSLTPRQLRMLAEQPVRGHDAADVE